MFTYMFDTHVFAKSCSFDHDTLQRIARDAFANELHETFAKEMQNRLHTFAIEQYLLKSSWRNHLARAITWRDDDHQGAPASSKAGDGRDRAQVFAEPTSSALRLES